MVEVWKVNLPGHDIVHLTSGEMDGTCCGQGRGWSLIRPRWRITRRRPTSCRASAWSRWGP